MKLVMIAGVVSAAVYAQVSPLTMSDVVRLSVEKYPSTKASLEQVSAAAAAVGLARTSYLPKADLFGQVNRATRNNVLGLFFPQPMMPGISGPVIDSGLGTNVWGSAVGLTASWEPFDFGFRKAQIDSAIAAQHRAEAAVERTKFEVASTAADAFLTVLAAERTVAAANAGVERSRVLMNVVEALAKAELRPGADLSRARAEAAMAETQKIQAEQAVAMSKAALGRLLNETGANVAVAAGSFLDVPRVEPSADAAAAAHPVAKEQSAAIDESKAREKIVDKSWYPKLAFEGSTYARGTGAHIDGTTGGAASGLGPNIPNWALGATLQFNLMEQPSLKARKEIEQAKQRTEAARYEQIVRDITSNVERAKAQLDGARRIAAIAPVQLEAARDTLRQATARYQAGLGNVVDVAEAQRLVTQTEIDESLARLSVWRALLAVSVAQGSLDQFLAAAK